jgi:glycosyltransferase involved in cell wall biosynthesis
MRIVVAVHHFPPRYTSGAELQAYRTAIWLRNHGYDVYVVCVEAIGVGNGHGLTFDDDIYEGLPVRRLSFELAAAPDPFRWTYNNLWIGKHLRGYLAELQPNLLYLISGYLMSGSALRAAVDLQIPTVVMLIDFWFLCPRITLLRSNGQLCINPFDPITCARCLGEEKRRHRILGQIAPRLMRTFWRVQSRRAAQMQARMTFLRETLNSADAVISNSRFLRGMFARAGFDAERIVFLRQGQDFPNLTPELLEKTPARCLRIGYLGQIARHKGVHTLFEAVQRLPGVDLEVKAYGDLTKFPDYVRRLRRMIRYDSRVSLMGMCGRSEIGRVLQDLDVVVVPSLWYENSPNIILEAFVHRTPVIASNLGGMAELVQDGANGLLFPPGDASSLAAQLRGVIDDPGLLPRLREGIGPVKSVAEEMVELQRIFRSVAGKAE